MGQVLCSFNGVQVRRVIDRGAGVVAEHAHDWPVLSIFVTGGYRNSTELGQLDMSGPSAVLYRAGAAHQNTIGPSGFEQIEIEFDAAWLGRAALPAVGVSRWVGGAAGAAARALGRTCAAQPPAAALRSAMRRFIADTRGGSASPAPSWGPQVDRRLREDPAVRVRDLARELGLHPAWVGAAYARAAGEGLRETAARLRVERAAHQLRESDEPPALIAASAGFSDQSHMIRSFRRVLGRTPSEVRSERADLRPSA